MTTTVAIIQRPPVLLDQRATLDRAVAAIGEAAAAGATLVVVPKSFVPGYPAWIWRLAAGKDGALIGQLHTQLLAHAVDLAAGNLHPVCETARQQAEIDTARVAPAQRALDVSGHYERPDIFQLRVNRAPAATVHFTDDDSARPRAEALAAPSPTH